MNRSQSRIVFAVVSAALSMVLLACAEPPLVAPIQSSSDVVLVPAQPVPPNSTVATSLPSTTTVPGPTTTVVPTPTTTPSAPLEPVVDDADEVASADVSAQRDAADLAAPTPAKSRPLTPRYRVNCPDGRAITVDYQPTLDQVRAACTSSQPTYEIPTDASSSGPATGMQFTVNCPDGSSHIFDRRLSDDEIREVCGLTSPTLPPPPPPTSTTRTIPPPRIVRVEASYQGGDWMAGMRIADDMTCPAVTHISFVAHYDNGSVAHGSTTVAVDDESRVDLPEGGSVRFIYQGPGGAAGCGRSIAW